MVAIDPDDLSCLYFGAAAPPAANTNTNADDTENVGDVIVDFVSSMLEIRRLNTSGQQEVERNKGRGLFAKQDIVAGDLLMIIHPIVASANVRKVRELVVGHDRDDDVVERHDDDNDDGAVVIAKASEQVLLETLQRALVMAPMTEEEDDDHHETTNKRRYYWGLVNSLRCLEGWDSTTNSTSSSSLSSTVAPSIGRLLGKDYTISTPATTITDDDGTTTTATIFKDDDLLQVIRRNAFGPDFITHERVCRYWKRKNGNISSSSISDDGGGHDYSSFLPTRLLGLYPLAAMINHACIPNAIRIFVGDLMVVHACQSIAKNTEIVWSYIPVVESFPKRQQQLLDTHGFVCDCGRCRVEAVAWDKETTIGQALHRAGTEQCAEQLVKSLEDDILQSKELSNEAKRYIRVGFLKKYMNYLNDKRGSTDATDLLNLCTQLHFSLVSCHNGSTEHLSILHLCYHLVSTMHASNSDPSKTLAKVRFWTDQLKRTILIRYGKVGNRVETVRELLIYTRRIFSTHPDVAQYKHFI